MLGLGLDRLVPPRHYLREPIKLGCVLSSAAQALSFFGSLIDSRAASGEAHPQDRSNNPVTVFSGLVDQNQGFAQLLIDKALLLSKRGYAAQRRF